MKWIDSSNYWIILKKSHKQNITPKKIVLLTKLKFYIINELYFLIQIKNVNVVKLKLI